MRVLETENLQKELKDLSRSLDLECMEIRNLGTERSSFFQIIYLIAFVHTHVYTHSHTLRCAYVHMLWHADGGQETINLGWFILIVEIESM